MDFFSAYIAGRGAVLGAPHGEVVAAAFAAFEPGLIAGLFEAATAQLPSHEIWSIVVEATGSSLRQVLTLEDVSWVADRLVAIVDEADATGRPLFAGVQSQPWPDDPYARLWQACLALREHRGDGHVAAYVSHGFDPVRMNVLTELWLGYDLGEYSATRAWSPERTAAAMASLVADRLVLDGQITLKGRELRTLIEARTDTSQAGIVTSLGDDLEKTITALDRWSATGITERMFPPDPRKRAAG